MSVLVTEARLEAPTLDAVAQCSAFVSDQASRAGYSAERVHEIELAVEEIVSNICRYSYGSRIGSVEVYCRGGGGDQLELQFIDGGQPFNILSLPAPDLALDLDQRAVGGIGAQMLRVLADQANYRRDGERNVLSVIFYPARRLGGSSSAA